MRRPATFVLSLAMLAAFARGEEWLDRVEDAFTVSFLQDAVRARLSGTLDLEGYHLPNPAPGVLDTDRTNLFSPRLTLFLDAQLGPKVYAFAQARVDRGFDPGESNARMRLDEFAIRVTPWDDGRLTLAVGKFGTVVGNWMQRHLSWDNPFINAPVPYENVTFAADMETPSSAQDFVGKVIDSVTKYEYLPVIWGPSYATGAAVSGSLGKFEYAAEVKNAALSSRPQSWELNGIGFERPSVNARIGFRPNQMWRFGLSAGQGPYLRDEAGSMLPAGRDLQHYHQKTLGQDISFAWHHWQVWAEVFQARFETPRGGNADTFLYYVEAKYKFTPQLFAAVRWNQQFYADVRDGEGGRAPWGHNLSRIDTALGYRFTAHSQLKLQYSLEREDAGGHGTSHTFAGQFTVRF